MLTLRDLAEILENLPNMDSEARDEIISQLENAGIDAFTNPIRKPGIQCPVTEMSLVSTCCISSCPYNIANEWHRNCLLDYLDTQGGENLSIEEIAFLYEDTPKNVKKVIDSGMTKLRDNSVQTMGFSGDFQRSKSPEIKANLGEDDEFKISRNTLLPDFMNRTNERMEKIIGSDLVFKHPAIRLLGILDSIITEL